MPGPADFMKLLGFKNRFESSHPKFAAFIGDVARRGVAEGDILEVSITRADGTKTTANMRVTQDDVNIVNELKNIR